MNIADSEVIARHREMAAQYLARMKSDRVHGWTARGEACRSRDYNVLPEIAAKFNNRRKNFEDHQQLKKLADPVTGEIEMLHIPTGFMMIDISVFHALADKVPFYVNRDGYGDMPKKVSDFFPVRVKDGIMESEDWAFCTICRENGIPVYLNTNIICDHTGSYTFDVPR